MSRGPQRPPRRSSRDVAQVHVPTDQATVFYVPGPHGGWFISLLYGFGDSIAVPMNELRTLLAGSRGEVIVARRLTPAEVGLVERVRENCDAEMYARIIVREEQQFRRPEPGDYYAKLLVLGAPKAGDERGRHREGA